MQDKKLVLDTLVAMVQQGHDISHMVGPTLAMKIQEIAEYQSLDNFEMQMSGIMEELEIDEEEIRTEKELKNIALDNELQQLKQKMKNKKS